VIHVSQIYPPKSAKNIAAIEYKPPMFAQQKKSKYSEELKILRTAIMAILDRSYLKSDKTLYFVTWDESGGYMVPYLEMIEADITGTGPKSELPRRAIRHVLTHDPELHEMIKQYSDLCFYRSCSWGKRDQNINDSKEAYRFLQSINRKIDRKIIQLGFNRYLDITPSPFALDEIFGASHGT
jgi:hypothetical protein